MNKTVWVKLKGNGDYEATFWFLGHKWHLQNYGPNRTWMIRHDAAVVQMPLSHFNDSRRMTHGDDSLIAALEQSKFQLLRLKYHKPTPTFHEQHLHYLTSTRSLEPVSQGLGT